MNGSDSTLMGGQQLPAPPHWARRKVSPAQADEIRGRYAEGETAAVLALEFGVSVKTVAHYAATRRGV